MSLIFLSLRHFLLDEKTISALPYMCKSVRGVPAKNRDSVINEVLYPLSRWLHGHPELQILQTIIILHAVLVVHVLAGEQLPSQVFLHDEPVLSNLLTVNLEHSISSSVV